MSLERQREIGTYFSADEIATLLDPQNEQIEIERRCEVTGARLELLYAARYQAFQLSVVGADRIMSEREIGFELSDTPGQISENIQRYASIMAVNLLTDDRPKAESVIDDRVPVYEVAPGQVPYFNVELIQGLLASEADKNLIPIEGICAKTGLPITLTHSQYAGTFTIKITTPNGQDVSFDIPDTTDHINDKVSAVNSATNLLMAGVMAQHPKLDAKTAAWAVEPDDRSAGFTDDVERYQRYFAFEGFDPDAAQRLAHTAATAKWDGLDLSQPKAGLPAQWRPGGNMG